MPLALKLYSQLSKKHDTVRITTASGEVIRLRLVVKGSGKDACHVIFEADPSIKIIREKLLEQPPRTERGA